MKVFALLAAAILTLTVGLGASDAEAKRLGAGRPLGMQRQIDAPKPATPPTVAPAPTRAAPTGAAPAAQAPARSSWLGPLAGLAAGIGLAALASHFGFGEELASLMVLAVLVMAVLTVVGLIMRKRAMNQQPALAGASGVHYRAPLMTRDAAEAPTLAGAQGGNAAAHGKIPAGFDVAGFLRSAKVHYIRLQAANDAGNLDDIRAFTTPEMFAELKMDIAERGQTTQETDVLDIDAEVLEIVEEGDRYVASVRFTGHIREEKNGPVETVDEVWHLVKPRDGSSGWLLAGIQPLH